MRIPLTAAAFAAASCMALIPTGSTLAAQRTMIPFADLGNIRDWQSDDPDELYVQSANRDWYRITFWAPCNGLPFVVGIGFVTDPSGRLDEYSSILVDGQRCWFKTFERSDAPAKESDQRKERTEQVK
jgi:hypothetical protein